jgi:hypothetical protein
MEQVNICAVGMLECFPVFTEAESQNHVLQSLLMCLLERCKENNFTLVGKHPSPGQWS